MSDTAVEDAPEVEETPEVADNEELTPDDELEPDDENETIDGPDEDEQVLAAAQTEKEIERRQKSLEKESERHAKRIREILGDDAEGLVKCEACPDNISGFHYSADYFEPGSPEHGLYIMLGDDTLRPMRQPSYLVVCEECNGHGSVLTGAVTDLTRTISCPVCKLAGYVDTRENTETAATPALPAAEGAPVVTAAATDELERDMWGRPKGHVRYGKFPIYLTDEERAADVADGFAID